MKNSLKTKILIGVTVVFITVMIAVMTVITAIRARQSRKESNSLLNNSFSTIRYMLSEKERYLIDNIQQTALLADMGGMVKYITDNKSFFKYEIMRPTYIKITDMLRNTNIAANIYRTCIYDMNGELIAFSINNNNTCVYGHVHDKQNIEFAELKKNEEANYDSLKIREHLPVEIESNININTNDKNKTKFQVINNVLCMVAHIPVMGKDYNPATEKMEEKQVGVIVAVQNISNEFIKKMTELSGANIHIYTKNSMLSRDFEKDDNGYRISDFQNTTVNWTLDKQNLIYKNIYIKNEDYYSAALPVYSNKQCIAVIAALYSKHNFHANNSQMIKLLSFVYLIGIAIIVPLTIFLVIRGIINPVKNIADMMRQIAQKKDFTIMLNVQRSDEIGDLAMSFNEMTTELLKTTTSVDNLNREINERKQIQSSLQQSEQKLQKLNNDLADVVSKLEESNNELKNFVYIASHDLREPLRTISSFGSLLEKSIKEKLEPDDAQSLHYIVDGAKRMSNMIEGLLSYSRISTKGHEFETVELNNIIDELKQYELNILLQETHTIINIPKPLPAIKADSLQMRQLLQNLIANGIKYQTRGNIPEITITSKPAADEMVRIEVADNGIGIAPEYHSAIFTMFKRLHNKKEYEGAGIGLAVCQKIILRHNGKIGIESQQGKGSTFWFILPAANSTATIDQNIQTTEKP